MVVQWNSSGISSQDSIRCSSVKKCKSYCWDWVKHQRILQEGSSSCRFSTTSHVDRKTTRKNASQMLDSYLFVCKKIRSRTMVIPRTWIGEKVVFYQWRESTRWMGQNGRKDDGDTRRKRTPSLPSHESIVQRSTQKQRSWKIVDTLCSRFGNDWDYISHNYFCKSAQSLPSRRRNVWKNMNPFMIERRNPLWEDSRVPHPCQAWSRQTCFWVMMTQWIKIFYCSNMENELKRCHNKTNWAIFFLWMQDFWMLLKLDNTSGLKILQNSHNFMQWPVVSTLCQEKKKRLTRKVWIRGNTKIGPVLEVTTCCLQGKYGVEIKIMSISKDNSHSWISISHGLNKLVTNLDNNEQETSEVQFEEYAPRLNASDFACRSKAKAKPQRRESASSSTRTIPIGERTWNDIEPENSRYPIFQCRRKWFVFFVMEVYLETMMERLKSGGSKTIVRNISCIFIIGLTKSGRKAWQEEEETRKDTSIILNSSGAILYLRALQGHSGRSLIDPTLQNNVIIPDGFFEYIHHVGCAITLHSITN